MTVPQKQKRPSLMLLLSGLVAALAFIGFIMLGNWQLERRAWKMDLIQRVNERVDAAAVAIPDADRWSEVSREADEYRHVWLAGQFLSGSDTLVVAATELGSGYWVMSPLQLADGGVVFINRGFIPQGVEPAPVPSSPVRVHGLLRISEPDGSVLRENQPENGRWFSRDVTAIAKTVLQDGAVSASPSLIAPFFIDAAAEEPGSPGADSPELAGPVGGLTVVRFHNSHLVYAITWYALAAMVLGAAVLVWRDSRKTA